ncbi:MAG: PAS domain S-box protein [Candidatus Aminicenantes bacterium]|nr:PAS domain S-box protein [Candidatus Aminicenantes bacterium]
MNKLIKKLSQVLDVNSTDAEDARRRKLLNVLLLAAAASAVVLLVVLVITAPLGLIGEKGQISILSLSIGITLISVGIIYVINWKISGKWARISFLTVLIAVACFSDKPEQVVDGRGLLVFVIPILAASFLLRPWTSFVVAAVSSAVTAIISLFFVHQTVPNVPAMLVFFMLATVSWLSAQSQKSAIEKLGKSEEKFRRLVETLNEGIWMLDEEAYTTFVNPKMAQMLGYSQQEMEGKHLFEFMDDEWVKVARDKLKERRKGILEAHEFVFQKKDGEPVHALVSTTPLGDQQGHYTGALAGVADISELKQTEEALRQSEEKMRNIVEHSTNLFYSHTVEHELTYLSPQSREFLQCSPEEAMVRWTEFATDNPINEKGFGLTQKAIETGKRQPPYELELVGNKGRKIWVEVREAPVVKDGKTVSIVGSLTDITERKKNQQRKKKELQEKTMLLSEIHHRVKNSLQIVASLLSLQSRQFEDDRILDMFQQSRNRIRMMATVYEKLYRSESFSRIDLKDYLEDVLDSMYRSSNIRSHIGLRLDVENAVISLDEAIPLALIVNELFTNSLKHAFPEEKEGVIEVRLKQLDEKNIQLIYRDNGVGLPDHIDFDTTESLGLHLIKNLAKQIEGEAVLEQNDWTTFKIEFRGSKHAP